MITPVRPEIGAELLWSVLPYLGTALCAGLIGWAMAAAFRQRYGGKLPPLLFVLPAAVFPLLHLRFGLGTELPRGGVLCLALLYASAADIRTREVPDCLPVTIAVAGLIGRELSELTVLLLAAAVVTFPQLAAAVWKPGSYGGADIKIMASCAFVLGPGKGLAAVTIGLLLAVVCTAILCKRRNRSIKESFALVPYLSTGSMLAFFL